ncbi:MAG: PilZ domain [Deltaproteobacteria bacterium]|jgi:c-di-GMP-binding flagellar brake protein YcgR|nr:PilZ domain [Deltaproteobacteria bacterium]MBP1718828.1 PilZ domain [Deltaproteobacteria bacterium]
MDSDNVKKVRSGIVNFERRKHPRISVDLPIEYSRVENAANPRNGRAANASQGGLLVYLPEQVQVGQALRLMIYFSIPTIQKVEITAEVAWVDIPMGEKPVEYRVGLKFLEILPEDQEKLNKFLKMISS